MKKCILITVLCLFTFQCEQGWIKDILFPKEEENIVIEIDNIVGLWRRLDDGDTHKGKKYNSNGTGSFGNFNNANYEIGSSFTWEIILNNISYEFHYYDTSYYNEEIINLNDSYMEQRRLEDGKIRTWQRQ